jgi:hypothetical protein
MSKHLQLIRQMVALLLLCACPPAVAQDDEEAPPSSTPPQEEEEAPAPLERTAPSFTSDAISTDETAAADSDAPPASGTAPRRNESASIRDPFWPIGYAPVVAGIPQKRTATTAVAAPPKVVEPPKWDEALKSLEVKGIMKTASGAYVAVVNGQVASEQEIISKNFLGKTYSWKISSISKAGIKFVRESVSQ